MTWLTGACGRITLCCTDCCADKQWRRRASLLSLSGLDSPCMPVAERRARMHVQYAWKGAAATLQKKVHPDCAHFRRWSNRRSVRASARPPAVSSSDDSARCRMGRRGCVTYVCVGRGAQSTVTRVHVGRPWFRDASRRARWSSAAWRSGVRRLGRRKAPAHTVVHVVYL